MAKHPTIYPGDRNSQVPRAKTLTIRWLKAMGNHSLAKAIDVKVDRHGASSVKGVKKVQAKHGLVVDGIIGPKTWAVLEKMAYRLSVIRRGAWKARDPKRPPTKVRWTNKTPTRVHHTASKAPRWRPWLFGTRLLNKEKEYMRSIQNYHMNVRKYNDIGYNYIIMPSGRVFIGRGGHVQGAHTLGHNNDCGIAFAGNYNIENMTKAQKKAYYKLRQVVGIAGGKEAPRKETFATSCPGKDVMNDLGL